VIDQPRRVGDDGTVFAGFAEVLFELGPIRFWRWNDAAG
jgi:hypothetical protein